MAEDTTTMVQYMQELVALKRQRITLTADVDAQIEALEDIESGDTTVKRLQEVSPTR